MTLIHVMPKYDLVVEFGSLFVSADDTDYLALGTDTTTGELVVAAGEQEIYRGYSLRKAKTAWNHFAQENVVEEFARRSFRGKSWEMILRNNLIEDLDVKRRINKRAKRRQSRIEDRKRHYITQLVLSGLLTKLT